VSPLGNVGGAGLHGAACPCCEAKEGTSCPAAFQEASVHATSAAQTCSTSSASAALRKACKVVCGKVVQTDAGSFCTMWGRASASTHCGMASKHPSPIVQVSAQCVASPRFQSGGTAVASLCMARLTQPIDAATARVRMGEARWALPNVVP
jgi:hypothetical protein